MFAKGRNLKDAALLKAMAELDKAKASDAQLSALDDLEKQSELLRKANKAEQRYKIRVRGEDPNDINDDDDDDGEPAEPDPDAVPSNTPSTATDDGGAAAFDVALEGWRSARVAAPRNDVNAPPSTGLKGAMIGTLDELLCGEGGLDGLPDIEARSARLAYANEHTGHALRLDVVKPKAEQDELARDTALQGLDGEPGTALAEVRKLLEALKTRQGHSGIAKQLADIEKLPVQAGPGRYGAHLKEKHTKQDYVAAQAGLDQVLAASTGAAASKKTCEDFKARLLLIEPDVTGLTSASPQAGAPGIGADVAKVELTKIALMRGMDDLPPGQELRLTQASGEGEDAALVLLLVPDDADGELEELSVPRAIYDEIQAEP